MQLCKLFKCCFNHFLISISISDLEILAKRVSVLYAVVHGKTYVAPVQWLFLCKFVKRQRYAGLRCDVMPCSDLLISMAKHHSPHSD